mmetsp:Transcript_5917/g.8691  ORF Transcript_5917/g.8691 Transcript_5917/m.8691 type:complete len:89 (+) Transcript_5917:712-978(+)
MKLLEMMPSHVEHLYHILKVPNNLATVADIEYKRFQEREQRELSRMKEVLDCIIASDCHAKLLAEHFEGANGPSNSTNKSPFPCGFCQ